MKVLVIATDGFGGHGGIALYTRNVLTALCAHPAQPQVVAVPRLMPFEREALPANLEWDSSGVGGKARFAAAVLRAALRSGPFDLVLCMHVHLLPLAFPIARAQGAPIVVFIYGIEVKAPTTKPIANLVISSVDGVISIRKRTTKSLRSWASVERVPTFHLENAIDLEQYGPGPKDPDLVRRFGLEGKRVIMTVSRLGERYIGVDEVLAALPTILRNTTDVVYLVAGDGPDLTRLRDKAQALGVASHVTFCGFVPNERKADYYRLGDVYAMPGSGPDFDRYPLRFAFLEAMACGVPVVGSRCEDDQERTEDGALLARQADPTNTDEIAHAILEALTLPKAVPAGLDRLGYPSFERRLHAVVDDVLATKGRRGVARSRRSPGKGEGRPCI